MKKSTDFLNRFRESCRRAGLKLTPQRMEVFAELARSTDHPSPETLYHRLLPRMPALSLDTVYRTLATLAQHNIVQKVETVQSQVRFEAVQPPHHHLICRECHEICDFPWASFDRVQLPKEAGSWGIVEKKSVVLTGICSKCRSKKSGKKRNSVAG
ncbi:MAG: transcriptional repressor [Acidobacteria bacterium]|nr:transcriptional repressor [Acidobacteriota bacterium]